ncbi:MAG: glycoside hydrolase 43 family protein [Bacteroidales bacterium]|nr:glycoside hydrolase 43 family protein [Bacteroidales bacterium]
MRKILSYALIPLVSILCSCGGDSFPEERSGDNGDGTFTNPVLWSDCPDPDLIRVGEDYYLVTTTMHLMPGAPIMHSKDLVNWEIVSYIFDKLEETPSYDMEGGTVYGRGQWATSLRYKDGRFFAYFTPNDQPPKGWVYSTTDPKTEKWELYSVLPHFHDASFFFDDNGKAYMVYGTGMIRELKPDLTGVLEGGLDMQLFERDSEENSLLEGSRMIKKDGKYYLLMISWPRGGIRREVCYRADRIEGPYEKKVILETPFGGLDAGVAQGTIFDDPQGNWYGFIFQDRDGLGRAPMLMPCTWIDGWPMLGDENGKVPEIMQKPVQGQPVKGITNSDGFDASELKLCWQWNHNPVDDAWSLTERPGYLRLKTNKVSPTLYTARNTITQRMEGPQSSGTVALDLKGMKVGDRAGFSAFNSDAAVMSVECRKDGKYLVLTEESVILHPRTKAIIDVRREFVDEVALKKDKIYLRIDADFRPGDTRDIAKLWYSFDNKNWNRIGNDYKMKFDWQRFFMGTKFAIFNYATVENGGYVDVDYFSYEKKNNQ